MGELRLRLKKVFDKEGIEIPWPHIKLFFGNAPEISIKRLAGQETPEASSDQQPSERKRHRKLPPD
jgi:small conductance mechanosensitive channel